MDACFCFYYYSFVSCSILLLLLLHCSVKRGIHGDFGTNKRRYPRQPGNIMNVAQNLMERLRPLVGIKGWDYCILWKLSEDQRYIEWMDCCCAGAVQNGGEDLQFHVSSVLPCRDVLLQHPITKSCELLAQLPSSLPLDSGIHAQTLILNLPRWLNFSHSSDSSVHEDTVGTRALIPVPGGLIELFVTKQVSEDQHVIDFVTSQCSLLMDQEAIINSTNMYNNFSVNVNVMTEHQSKPLHDNDNEERDHTNLFRPLNSPETTLENMDLPYDISVDRIHLCNPEMSPMQQFNYNEENKTKNGVFFEGAENGFQDIDALQKSMMTNTQNIHMQFMESLANTEQKGNDKDSIKHETGRSGSLSDCSDQIDDEDDAKFRRRNGEGPQSKNLHAERKRRKRLNERLYDLRALVPKISKLNKASILGDAIEFVEELQKQVKELQDELEEHSDGEGANNDRHNNIPSLILSQNGVSLGPTSEHVMNGFHVGASGDTSVSKQNQDSEIAQDKGQQMEPQVEVAPMDGNEFFVKVFCEHKPGGFVRLMEALESLGLEVTNVNVVTSFRTLVSNVFIVKKKGSEMVQADYVRDSLLELTRNPPRGWPEMAKASENCTDMDYHQHHHHHHLHSGHINSNHHHLPHVHN